MMIMMMILMMLVAVTLVMLMMMMVVVVVIMMMVEMLKSQYTFCNKQTHFYKYHHFKNPSPTCNLGNKRQKPSEFALEF